MIRALISCCAMVSYRYRLFGIIHAVHYYMILKLYWIRIGEDFYVSLSVYTQGIRSLACMLGGLGLYWLKII